MNRLNSKQNYICAIEKCCSFVKRITCKDEAIYKKRVSFDVKKKTCWSYSFVYLMALLWVVRLLFGHFIHSHEIIWRFELYTKLLHSNQIWNEQKKFTPTTIPNNTYKYHFPLYTVSHQNLSSAHQCALICVCDVSRIHFPCDNSPLFTRDCVYRMHVLAHCVPCAFYVSVDAATQTIECILTEPYLLYIHSCTI